MLVIPSSSHITTWLLLIALSAYTASATKLYFYENQRCQGKVGGYATSVTQNTCYYFDNDLFASVKISFYVKASDKLETYSPSGSNKKCAIFLRQTTSLCNSNGLSTVNAAKWIPYHRSIQGGGGGSHGPRPQGQGPNSTDTPTMSAVKLSADGPGANAGVFSVQDDVAYIINAGSDKLEPYLKLQTEDQKAAYILANYDELEPLSQEAADALNANGIIWSPPTDSQ